MKTRAGYLIYLLEKKKAKDKKKEDPINPSKKTKTEARKCLDKINKDVEKDPRTQQELGNVPPDQKDTPPMKMVPQENDNGKSD